jgi:type I restriction enzyme S subunit
MKKGWLETTVGEACILRSGTTLPKEIEQSSGEIPYLKVADMNISENLNGVTCSSRYVNKVDVNVSNLLPVGTTIFPKRGGAILTNKKLLLSRVICADLNIMGVTPKSGLLAKLLFYYFLRLDLREINNGSSIPQINNYSIEPLLISFPESLPEQRRIVGILDEAFEGIATAKANAEKNLQNARAIFESYLQSVFTQRGEGWVDRTLDQVCIVERGSSPRPIKNYFTTEPDGVNWIKIGDTEEGGKYVYSTAQKITPEGAKRSRFVKEGDFILTNSMSFGRPYIMKINGYIHDGWFVLRLNISIDTDYFYYLLSSRFVQSQFAQLASGSVVKNISGDLVKKAVLPIPPLAYQHVIVKKLLGLSAETRRLESIYQQKLAALEALKKSLLHQAFTGQLTAGELNQPVSVAIPFPQTLPNISTTDLHAGVLAMACQLHEKNNKMGYFTHVKAEKIAHMVEARLGISLGRKPVKDAAGPNDFPHLLKVEYRARNANYFDFKQFAGGAYQVHKLRGFERLIDKTRIALGQRLADVEHLLQWMLPMKVKQAEIVATVYAAWNNLFLDGKQPTDEEIVREAREDWHPDKLKIERERFFNAVKWLKEQGVVPEGKGQRVMKKGE